MAQWSSLWNLKNGSGRRIALHNARFIPPALAKAKKGGKFPHLQPFFKYAEVKDGK